MPTLTLYYEEESDILYVEVGGKVVASSKIIDDKKWIDYTDDGEMAGLQLFEASERFPFLKRECLEQELVGGGV